MGKDTIKIEKGSTLLIAHRGLSGLELQNTGAAFVLAGGRSYFGIETDIHRTATPHKYAVIHDGTTGGVSEEDVHVETSESDVLENIRLRRGNGYTRSDMRIPWLEDYITICRDYGKKCVLEFKNDFTDEEVADIINICRELGWLENVIFISFISSVLERVRAQLPDQPIQFLTGKWTDTLCEYLKKYNFGLDIDNGALTEERIKEAHANGIVVNAYTVDSKEKAEQLVSWGIDYITTNILE